MIGLSAPTGHYREIRLNLPPLVMPPRPLPSPCPLAGGQLWAHPFLGAGRLMSWDREMDGQRWTDFLVVRGSGEVAGVVGDFGLFCAEWTKVEE